MGDSLERGLVSDYNEVSTNDQDGKNLPKKSQDAFLARGITFTRGFTFTGTQNSFRRAISTNFGVQDDDADEMWTRRLLDTYLVAKHHGAEGDVPLPAEFARDIDFWKAMLLICILAVFIGCTALVFLNFTDVMPKIWTNDFIYSSKKESYFQCDNDCHPFDDNVDNCSCDKYNHCDFYQGKPYWIIVTTITGVIVGFLRYILNYPDVLPGIFKEILDYHVDPTHAPTSFLLSAISLAGGLSLGPEQALASLGGGIATFLTQKHVKFDDDNSKKLVVLAGMACALGALFPSPILGVLMLFELGKMPKSFMESCLVMSCGACVSFMIYYYLVDMTFLESISSNSSLLSFEWDFNEWNCLTSIIIGIVCAPLGIVIILSIGITRQLLNRLRIRLLGCTGNQLLVSIFPPTLSGFIVGCLAYALPLTVGNGNLVLKSIVVYTYQNKLSTHLLVCTGFAKAFALGLSMNGGFVGGIVFPMITIATIAGCVCHKLYPEIPLGLSIGCFMAGLPASLIPMPFTLSALAIFIFHFGLYQTVPIFLSTIVSYTLVCGTGFYGSLVRRNQETMNPDKSSLSDRKPVDAKFEENKKLEETFAFEHYFNAKQQAH